MQRRRQGVNGECIGYLLSEKFCGPEKDRICTLGAFGSGSLGLLLGLLGQKDSLDVGEDTTLGNGNTGEELVQFLVIANGKLEVTGDDPCLLVVTGSIAGELEDLSSEVLHDGSQVDWSTSTYTLSIVALAEETVNTSYRELKSSPGATGL